MKPHTIIAVPADYKDEDEIRVLHLAVFPDVPVQQELDSLEAELKTGNEFKLTEEFVLINAPPAVLKEFEKDISFAFENIKKTLN